MIEYFINKSIQDQELLMNLYEQGFYEDLFILTKIFAAENIAIFSYLEGLE